MLNRRSRRAGFPICYIYVMPENNWAQPGSATCSLRVRDGDLIFFRERASIAGLSFNAWVVKALRQAATYELALEEEGVELRRRLGDVDREGDMRG